MTKVHLYLRKVTPLNVLDLLDTHVLDNLLNGYSFAIKSGMAIVYPTAQSVSLDTLERKDALGTDVHDTFHPICSYWRDAESCNMESHCIQADKHETLKYFNGNWSGPRLYCCQLLKLWDMSFPLIVEKRIVGVLFAGQIIVDGSSINWRKELNAYYKIIDWTTCPDCDEPIGAIKRVIDTYNIPKEHKTKLLEFLHSEKISIDEFKKRVEDFLRFGEITQGLLNELYKARKSAAEQQLLRGYSDALDAIDLTDQTQWWKEYGQLLERLTALPEIEALRLFVRKRSHYLREVPQPHDPINPQRISARNLVPVFPTGQLVAVDDKGLVDLFGLGGKKIWGYRSEIGTGHEVCSTLVVFRGTIPETQLDFLVDLCGVVCKSADSAHLIFREREAEQKYRRKVALIGHFFRTPLQDLQFKLEAIAKVPPILESEELQQNIKSGMDRIYDASIDLSLLLESGVHEEEEFDFIESLNYVIKGMDSIAQQHPCAIIRQGKWPTGILVRGSRYRIERALTCLVDNAIKYSFRGWRQEISRLYEVRIGVIVEENYIKVMLNNYGIGIPKEKLEAIREYGFRANVIDEKKKRLGTGLGLPFAIDVFEESGGWLHIDSVVAESATEEEKKIYLRYVTTVEAVLPILRRN